MGKKNKKEKKGFSKSKQGLEDILDRSNVAIKYAEQLISNNEKTDFQQLRDNIRTDFLDIKEQQGFLGIFQYFNRINDKLFSFNNLLIAGYFTIIAVPKIAMHPSYMLIPIINMAILLYIDYFLVNKSKHLMIISTMEDNKIDELEKSTNMAFKLSSLTIITTSFVVVVFLVKLLYLYNNVPKSDNSILLSLL